MQVKGWSAPSFDSLELERLLVQPYCLSDAAGTAVGSWRGRCGCSACWGGWARALSPLCLSVRRYSAVIASVGAAGGLVGRGEVAAALERLGVVGPELRLRLLEGRLENSIASAVRPAAR